MALPTQGFTCIYKTVLLLQKGVQTPAIPFACFAAQLCAARLRLDCTKFRRVCFADLLKVTIATNTNTKSILMVSRYSNMSLARHIVTVSISVGDHH